MSRPVVWSASSVWTYQQCSLRWWFAYVAAMESEPTEAMTFGISVHDAAEQILRGTLPPDGFDAMPPIDGAMKVFANNILPTYGTPILIEEPFQIEVNGIPFSGVIDSLDQHILDHVIGDPVMTILRDLKTTGSRPSAGKYRFNMIGYWLGAMDLGHHVDRIMLDYIVRTKTPYYWPEVQPNPTQDEIDLWAAELENVANRAARELYAPDGLYKRGACKSCDYASICGPYQRMREEEA